MSVINHLRGQVLVKSPTHLVIECNGVGYGLLISLQTFTKLGEQKEALVYVESVYVRDDNPRFYGFADEEERGIFRQLISVSGVGGGSALLMLSSMSAGEITAAINTANVALLKSIKGIGDKTAQRIVVDLKGKLGKHEGGISQILTVSNNKTRDEALMALVTLGFPKIAAERALEKAIRQQGASSDQLDLLIKAALKNF
ncbi:MAG: Holliday junction branch migration protein RuvA [Bacteroidia bacterium]|jgi:Holliday junction DNA helicase RuvA|nr:Holliday junction branch migration protein RuvA [Bacteroidia bacterium]